MSSSITRPEPGIESGGDVLGYAGASIVLGVKITTLYAWVHQHRVPCYKIGNRCIRFRRSELLAWLKGHAVAAEE